MMATQDQYQMASLVDLEAREEASMSEIEHTIYTTQLALQEYTQWDRRYSSSVRMSESMYCTPANAHPFSPMPTKQHAVVTAFFVLQHIRNAEQTTVMHRCNPRSPFPTTIRIIVPRSPPTAHHLPPSPTITHHHTLTFLNGPRVTITTCIVNGITTCIVNGNIEVQSRRAEIA